MGTSPTGVIEPVLSFKHPLVGSTTAYLTTSVQFNFGSSTDVLISASATDVVSVPSVSIFYRLSMIYKHTDADAVVAGIEVQDAGNTYDGWVFRLHKTYVCVHIMSAYVINSIFLQYVACRAVCKVDDGDEGECSVFTGVVISVRCWVEGENQ